MRGKSDNIASLTDQLDNSNKFSNFQADKGTIYFLNKSHQKYYNYLIKKVKVSGKSQKVLALFYILSSLKKFREKPGLFLDFKDLKIKPQIFKKSLSCQEQALIQLAFYLYTEKNIFNLNIMDLFDILDQERASIAISAVKLRFKLYI
ncbi:MAG: DUF6075 family protein [Bacillota bacterium]